jgi:hypothetical protein
MSVDGDLAEHTARQAYGASRVGPFDSCPKVIVSTNEEGGPAVFTRDRINLDRPPGSSAPGAEPRRSADLTPAHLTPASMPDEGARR